MAEQLSRAVDPRDGFYDIKPVPDFFPPDYSLLWVLLGLFLLSLALFMILALRRRGVGTLSSNSPLSARAELDKQLLRLKRAQETESITVREFASELSLAMRQFIESKFQFPATDRTVAETLELIAPRLAGLSQQQTPDQNQQQLKELKVLLRFLERTTFAGREAERLTIKSQELTSALIKGEALANAIELLLRPTEANETELNPLKAAS